MRLLTCLAALFLLGAPARAEVAAAAPDGFAITQVIEIAAAPGDLYRDLGRIGRWWADSHTYSGAARNMSLDLRAGGCFCERWAGGTVEHGRVIVAMPGQTLRLAAALGPLQEMGLAASLTFAIAPQPGGSRLTLRYNVSGSSLSGLAAIAPAVDGVLAAQLARLKSYAETGAPE